jgi:hypothetical protein
MRRPPRNVAVERLMDARLVCYAYVGVALVESLLCVGAFFLAMAQRGYPIADLLYNKAFWADPPLAARDAYFSASAAYFFTLVLCQCAVHAFTIKTSRSSLCTHPWWKNPLTNAGALVGPSVALIVIYLFHGVRISRASPPPPFPPLPSCLLSAAHSVNPQSPNLSSPYSQFFTCRRVPLGYVG